MPPTHQLSKVDAQAVGDAQRLVPFLALPSSNGHITMAHIEVIESLRSTFPVLERRSNTTSLLDYNFNILYADALNARKRGVTHFLMIHNDIIPRDPPQVPGAPVPFGWAEQLFTIMVQNGLGALCATAAIKHEAQTDTSCALDNTTNQPMAERRLRLEEFAGGKLITSRDEPRLLINTGCLAIDLTQPWSDFLYFASKSGIRKNDTGLFEPWVTPEDYNLSRQLRRLGVPFGATSAVWIDHVGTKGYSNQFIDGKVPNSVNPEPVKIAYVSPEELAKYQAEPSA